jgi:hypothetical protein
MQNARKREPVKLTGILLNADTPSEATVEVFLEAECGVCNGSGNGIKSGYACRNCWGTGVVLTTEGETLLDFMANHLRTGNFGRIGRNILPDGPKADGLNW